LEGPFIRIEESGELFPLQCEVTTVGRGNAVDVRLGDPSVSRLHAEIIRRGPYTYVVDLGLSRNGTRVNGRPIARRVLEDGDVVSFGAARCRVGGIPHEDIAPEVELRRSAAPELTRRELDVLTSLCRPALSDEAFVAPATAREIAADLVVTEAAVKQHLLRLYQKFRIPEGPNRRTRLANEVVALGLVRPLPPADRGGKAEAASPGGTAAHGGKAPPGASPQGTGSPQTGPNATAPRESGPQGTTAPRGTGTRGGAGPRSGGASSSGGGPGAAVPQSSTKASCLSARGVVPEDPRDRQGNGGRQDPMKAAHTSGRRAS
jgi:FHA domain